LTEQGKKVKKRSPADGKPERKGPLSTEPTDRPVGGKGGTGQEAMAARKERKIMKDQGQ